MFVFFFYGEGAREIHEISAVIDGRNGSGPCQSLSSLNRQVITNKLVAVICKWCMQMRRTENKLNSSFFYKKKKTKKSNGNKSLNWTRFEWNGQLMEQKTIGMRGAAHGLNPRCSPAAARNVPHNSNIFLYKKIAK